jgi:uncharacterized membrane protein YphA (DoxX/SURF4 family)
MTPQQWPPRRRQGGARPDSIRRRLMVLGRITTGFIFIAAGALKMWNHEEFMQALATYKLFSLALTDVVGVLLPVVEIMFGVLLVFGIRTRAVSLVTIGLLVAFTLVVLAASLQGHAVACGCFPVAEEQTTIGIFFFVRNGLLVLFLSWMAFNDERAISNPTVA